jgi:hypothetical protein
MTKIRSFSGEFQRKLLFPEIQVADPSFEQRLDVTGDDSSEEQIEKILLCLLESEYPYKDLKSAVLAISDLIFKETKKEKSWKPRVWYEISPGKIVIGEGWSEKVYYGSDDMYME